MMNYPSKMVPASPWSLALAAASPVHAVCSHTTKITNSSSITLRFADLKSFYAAPIFKSQWSGSRVIAPGATATISWTSDLNCTDASGVPNHWDVKLIRNNGNVHYHSYLAPGQDVRVNTPDLCFPL